MPTQTTATTLHDWRCRCCRNLLGKHDGRQLHVRLSRGYSYSACLPAMATCRCCGRLNDLPRGSAI